MPQSHPGSAGVELGVLQDLDHWAAPARALPESGRQQRAPPPSWKRSTTGPRNPSLGSAEGGRDFKNVPRFLKALAIFEALHQRYTSARSVWSISIGASDVMSSQGFSNTNSGLWQLAQRVLQRPDPITVRFDRPRQCVRSLGRLY